MWRGKRGSVFFSSLFWRGSEGGGGRLEIFQRVPFCFQRKLHLCKCALCPFAYCLNSIVDFLWEAHRGLGALGAKEVLRGAPPEKLGPRTTELWRHQGTIKKC